MYLVYQPINGKSHWHDQISFAEQTNKTNFNYNIKILNEGLHLFFMKHNLIAIVSQFYQIVQEREKNCGVY